MLRAVVRYVSLVAVWRRELRAGNFQLHAVVEVCCKANASRRRSIKMKSFNLHSGQGVHLFHNLSNQLEH